MKYGVKIYSYDWLTKHALSVEQAACSLDELGIDFVIAQNQFVPMADNAIASKQSVNGYHVSVHDDLRFIEQLHRHGIEYWAACNVFFDPLLLEGFPDAIPIDKRGESARKIDWYIGSCPTHEGYLKEKIYQITRAVTNLRPDGIHLGFVRFPGFWELWLPYTCRKDHPEYCFCQRCCRKFSSQTHLQIPAAYNEHPWDWAQLDGIYARFVEWKGDVITGTVASIRQAIWEASPGTPIMLNTLPFRQNDFDNAGHEVFGQDWRKLYPVVDIFEIMTYHQILGQDTSWIADVTHAMKESVPRPIASTIQVSPLYTHGMHAGSNRQTSLPASEFREAILSAKRGGADRIIFFTWDELLGVNPDDSILRKREIIMQQVGEQ